MARRPARSIASIGCAASRATTQSLRLESGQTVSVICSRASRSVSAGVLERCGCHGRAGRSSGCRAPRGHSPAALPRRHGRPASGPARPAAANTRANFSGGWPSSEESSPTAAIRSSQGFGLLQRREGGLLVEMAQEAEDQLRGDAVLRLGLRPCPASSPRITVSKAMPRSVWVCGSKKISAWTTLSAAARSK